TVIIIFTQGIPIFMLYFPNYKYSLSFSKNNYKERERERELIIMCRAREKVYDISISSEQSIALANPDQIKRRNGYGVAAKKNRKNEVRPQTRFFMHCTCAQQVIASTYRQLSITFIIAASD
ncbi:hypothetical protein ACJX0J_006794, partial [Zea mays]